MTQFEYLCILISILALIVQAIGVLHPIVRDLVKLAIARFNDLRELDENEF